MRIDDLPFDGQVDWRDVASGPGIDPTSFVLKAGDTLTGPLVWNRPIGMLGAIIDDVGLRVTDGVITSVMASNGFAGGWFLCLGDEGGFIFGSPTNQDGGLGKATDGTIILRQSRADSRPVIQDNAGANQWTIIDERGGDLFGSLFLHRTAGNVTQRVIFTDDTSDLADLYGSRAAAGQPDADGARMWFRAWNRSIAVPGMESFMRTREGNATHPANLMLLSEPIDAQDAATKRYVDDSIVAGGGYVDAPSDGTCYGRYDGAWMDVRLAGTGLSFRTGLTLTGFDVDLDPATLTAIGGMLEAPADGLIYGRNGQTGTWAAVTAQAASFNGAAVMITTGTEVAGDVMASLTIPPEQLPNRSFFWMALGNGDGGAFLMTDGAAGPTAGTYVAQVNERGFWISFGLWTINPTMFPPGAPVVVRAAAGGTPGASRAHYYDPAIDTQGIRLQCIVSVPANVGGTYVFAVEGRIIAYT
jgi:hypothetical protein